MATTERGALRCDMSSSCTAPITHVDSDGYIYCTTHGVQRQATHRCRKLRTSELQQLRRGATLARYEVIR